MNSCDCQHMRHFGLGFLYRDQKGKELGRTAIEFWDAWPLGWTSPNHLRNNELSYDDLGRLAFGGHSVTSLTRSRGDWQEGYWHASHLLGVLDSKTYSERLPAISQFQVD